MARLEEVTIEHQGRTLIGELARPEGTGPFPGVLVVHTAFGRGEHMREACRQLAGQGYLALAVDMYGTGAYTEVHAEIASMITPLQDPDLLRSRMQAWLDALRQRSDVHTDRIAAIGYCFGGQCVLELARGGADLQAVVSYHGLLSTRAPAVRGAVNPQVAVYTGALDPHAPREHVEQLRSELTDADARWQITEFGDAYHAFTDPEANTPETGRCYNAQAHLISWAGTLALFQSVLR